MFVQPTDVFSASDVPPLMVHLLLVGCRESYAPETGRGRADLMVFLSRTLEGTQGMSSSKHAGFPTLRRSDPLCLSRGADQHIPVP